MKNKYRSCALALLALCTLFISVSCVQKTTSFSLPHNQRVGVAGFYQPTSTGELLAGYMPDNARKVEAKILMQLDDDFDVLLRSTTSRDYVGIEKSYQCAKKASETKAASAFEFWLDVGKCMNVEVILVPQLHAWQERDGSNLGAEHPAAVVMDFFLLDVQHQVLLARSRFDETQKALTSNILDIGKYINRGGKWVSAEELAKEGMTKAVRELGL